MNVDQLKRLFLVGFMALAAATCSTTDAGRAQVTLYDDDYLEVISRQIFENDRKSKPLVTDPNTISFVECVSNTLLKEMSEEDQELYWELAIFDIPAINASAMPGGKLSVYSGMVDLTENQDQMASVMGHEMAHVTAKHMNERMSRQAITDAGIEVAALLAGGGYYNQTAGAYQAMKAFEDLGINKPFSRKHETEADEIGIIYLARAGFDPRESVKLWRNMSAQRENEVNEMLSTHPSDASRIEAQVSQLPGALAVYNQAIAEGKTPNCRK